MTTEEIIQRHTERRERGLITIAHAFETIDRSIRFPSPRSYVHTSPATASAYDVVARRYGLEEKECAFLSLIVERHLDPSFPQRSCRFLGFTPGTAIAIRRKLIDLGILNLIPGNEAADDICLPDEAFLLSIEKDIPLEEAMDESLMAGLNKLIDDLSPACESSSRRPIALPPGRIRINELSNFFDDKEKPVNEIEELIAPFDEMLVRYSRIAFAATLSHLTEGLSVGERSLLYGFIYWFRKNFTQPARKNSFPGALSALFDEHLPSLTAKNLVVAVYVWEENRKSSEPASYRITPEVAEVFRGKESIIQASALSQYGAYVPSDKIEEKELFFSDEDLRNLNRIVRSSQPDEYDRIIAALKERKMRPCLSALMYGPPGTGKTELACQIARRTGRALLKVDASKLNGIYVGEASLNIREFFQRLRLLYAVSTHYPILFIDEADGLLGQRITNVRNGSDKDSNTAQNILLEELNSIPGILLATTNLLENLDDAMLRRFMMKIEFHLPDREARQKIWLSKCPGITPDDAAFLAGEYSFSGGFIDNAVSMAIVDSILESREITVQDLISSCDVQNGWHNGQPKKIGY